MIAPYPDSFFIIHRRFAGPSFPPEGTWGDISDGPVASDEDVICEMLEAWKDEQHEPDETDFRVWQIGYSKFFGTVVAEDCTAWALRTMIEVLQEEHEE